MPWETERGSAVKRGRGLGVSFVGGVAGFCVLGVLLSAVAADGPATTRSGSFPYAFTVSEKTTYITKPLLADGRVDFVTAMNERCGKGVKPEENGFVEWLKWAGPREDERSALAKLLGMKVSEMGPKLEIYGQVPPAKDGKEMDDLQQEMRFLDTDDLKESSHPHFAGYLKEHGKILDGLAGAVRKKVWWEPWIGAVSIPGGSWLEWDDYNASSAGDWFHGRALLRLGRGDGAGYLSDVETLFLLARAKQATPSLGGPMDASDIQEKALDAVEFGIQPNRLNAQDLKRLAELVGSHRLANIAADNIGLCPRIFALQIAQTLAVRKEWGDLGDWWEGTADAFKKIDRHLIDFDELMRSINGTTDVWVKAVREKSPVEFKKWGLEQLQPDIDDKVPEPDTVIAGETRKAYTARVSHWIVGMTVIMRAMTDDSAEFEVQQDEMEALVAAARFHVDKGRWPRDLGELSPGYLKRVPVDPYSKDGAALRFGVGKGGPYVFSVGENGKDDGGREDDISAGKVPEKEGK